MNRDELLKRYNSLETELKKLKEEIDKPDLPFWIPKTAPTASMYYINAVGGVSQSNNSELITMGNYFETRELAEKHVKKLMLLEEIKQWKGKNDPESFKLDWINFDEVKYHLTYNHKIRAWEYESWKWKEVISGICFSSSSAVWSCIAYFGDRLNILLES